MKINFTVDGKPGAKQRPRFNMKTGHTYTPDKTFNYEQWVKLCYYRDCKDMATLDGAIHAEIVAYYPINKGTSEKKKQLMELGYIDPIVKPDLDNIAKIVLDAVNKVAIVDDGHITRLVIEKHYSLKPRVEVTFETVENPRIVKGE